MGNGGRLASVAYPLAGMNTAYAYLPASGDFRLSSIQHQGPGGAALATYGYTYRPDGNIATWSRTQPGMNPGTLWSMAYDRDQQLLDVLETTIGAPLPSPQRLWRNQYDASGNRTSHQRPGRTETGAYNPRNQLTSLSGGGPTVFRGQVNEPAQVTLDGKSARVFADGTFEASVELGAGTQQVTVQATDRAANTKTETWQVDNGPATRSLTYDVHGNTLTDGMRSYTWDARNRLTGITRGSDTWTLAYNGANLRTSESRNGQVQRTWVWHGTEVVEERLANGTKRRYWSYGIEELNAQGTQTGKRFLMQDHLGSTRVVLDGAGATVASYDHDPWGVRRKLSVSGEEAVGYTGHWEHESGLILAPYRVYDPGLARWLSEDPIAEAGGVNLYGYVGNGPVGRWDPLGFRRYDYDSDGFHVHVPPSRRGGPGHCYAVDWSPDGNWKVRAKNGHEHEFDQKRAIADMMDAINDKNEVKKMKEVNKRAFDELTDTGRVRNSGRGIRRARAAAGLAIVSAMLAAAEMSAAADRAGESLKAYKCNPDTDTADEFIIDFNDAFPDLLDSQVLEIRNQLD